MSAPQHFVTHAESEALVKAIERAAADASAGIFGPASVMWRFNRESAIFLGAGRAALLQLAHPWVATSLQQHSRVMADPIARFHNTFRVVFTMIFGTVQQAGGAARHLYRLHTHIQGEMAENVAAYARGSHYQANEIAALRWVYATLIESAVLAYEFVLPPLSVSELERYYTESKILAGLFGLPPEALPSDWNAFLHYCREMEQSSALGVSKDACAMGQSILAGAGSWIHPPPWYRALTTAWLPEPLRGGFGLSLNGEDESAIERARGWLTRVYRRLPDSLRFVGPWHEAQARLKGRRPGLGAKAGNHFWIGQTRMPLFE